MLAMRQIYRGHFNDAGYLDAYVTGYDLLRDTAEGFLYRQTRLLPRDWPTEMLQRKNVRSGDVTMLYVETTVKWQKLIADAQQLLRPL